MSKKIPYKFEKKVWLSSPTIYKESMDYMKDAYETNWMSTVGANIDELERLVAKKLEQGMQLLLHREHRHFI